MTVNHTLRFCVLLLFAPLPGCSRSTEIEVPEVPVADAIDGDELLELTPEEADRERQRQLLMDAANRANEANGSTATVPELFPNAVPVSDLEAAASLGNVGDAKIAIRNGASVNEPARATSQMTGVEGWTVLHVAADSGHLDIVELLVELGADVDAELASGETPLDLATKKGHAEVVECLSQR